MSAPKPIATKSAPAEKPFGRRLWGRISKSRREAGASTASLALWGAAAASLFAGGNAAAGPEGWRIRLGTAWLACLWIAAPIFIAWAARIEIRRVERSGFLDELLAAGIERERLDAVLRWQAVLGAALPVVLGAMACGALMAAGASYQNGSVRPWLALAKTVGPMPLALGAFCAILAGEGAAMGRGAVIGALGYWSAFGLLMPKLAAYPAVYLRLLWNA